MIKKLIDYNKWHRDRDPFYIPDDRELTKIVDELVHKVNELIDAVDLPNVKTNEFGDRRSGYDLGEIARIRRKNR